MTPTHPQICPYCNGNGCSCDDGEVMTESMREQARQTDATDPKWVRGECPGCGALVISNMHHIRGKGYLVVWSCENSMGENPTCSYRRVL